MDKWKFSSRPVKRLKKADFPLCISLHPSVTNRTSTQTCSEARPSTPRKKEHLSTRSLRFDREGLIYIVIRKQAVAMCKIDRRLNATQLCNAAGLTKGVRDNYIKIVKGRCVVTHIKVRREPKHSWVPFKDGVFLCQALTFCDEMKPLFSPASLDVPREEENYLLKRQSTKAKLPDGYNALQWDGNSLVYIPSTRKVHAAQLLKLGNISNPRVQLAQFFSHNHEVLKEVLVGHRQAQGSYIGFEDARLLYRHFYLSEDPVDEIIRQEMVSETSVLGDYKRTSHIYHYEGTYDFENQDTREDGDKFQEDPNVGFCWNRRIFLEDSMRFYEILCPRPSPAPEDS